MKKSLTCSFPRLRSSWLAVEDILVRYSTNKKVCTTHLYHPSGWHVQTGRRKHLSAQR
ncbi:hypothetical protein CY34DRAFT_426190 [Suillus luteus UH-Slu-Lm8-n1]|uniref:Uncharacterized protein n=1 Tax=Suillus luteus UH-Slu-Lm8-n1 TaxID=930992 RepID=A0A0D0AI64_9AGAM|nr:hypothetical protein CY34DRAFT_426190 [Suillus luteus UH-Slu-Lm8-n1]